MTLSGLTGFSSEWIKDCAIKTTSLRQTMKKAENQTMRTPLHWTNKALIAYETIKQYLKIAQALAIPDYDKPLLINVSNCHDMYASVVLMHKTCSGHMRKRQQ